LTKTIAFGENQAVLMYLGLSFEGNAKRKKDDKIARAKRHFHPDVSGIYTAFHNNVPNDGIAA